MQSELKQLSKKIDSIFLESNFPNSISIPFLKKALVAYPNNGGKKLRPAMCQWFCGAVNGKLQSSLHISAALEMFHTWTLVHDDIIDRDSMRRNQPTCHEQLTLYALESYKVNKSDAQRFGNSMAILIGDLQQAWVWSLIQESKINNDTKELIRNLFANSMSSDVLSGEAIDIHFEYCSFEEITIAEILTMFELKTARLLQLCAKIGVIIGLELKTLDHPLIQAADDYAKNLGIAFQIYDDILGIFADESQLGKPTGNDIEKRKITLLYKKALEMSSAQDKQFLLDIFGKKHTKDNLIKAKKIIIDCGAKKFAEDKVNHYHKIALQSLNQFPNKTYTSLLQQLADFIIHRKF